MKASEKIIKYDFYIGWYYPSNGAIAKAVHIDLDQYFQSHNISGNMENGESYRESTTFVDADMRYLTALV